MKTRIVLVDDHPITIAGISSIINTDKSLEIIGTAFDAKNAISLVKETKPDLVIMDINMPTMSGIEATRLILKEHPKTKVVALSMHSGHFFVKEMLEAGAVGYLLKEEASDELLLAIKKLSKGQMYLSSGVTRVALTKAKKTTSINILQTNFHKPLILNYYVTRTDIIKKLEDNVIKPLSIVTAAKGYGKSIVVSQWLEKTSYKYVWLSLDEKHNNLKSFFNYFCYAIETVFPDALANTIELLELDDIPSSKTITESLINDLCNIESNFIFALDDFHLIHEMEIHKFIDEWLRFPPPCAHLCLITRRDLPIRINFLRNTNRLTEIRMKNLSFSYSETSQFFKKSAGKKINEQFITLIQEKTEGWVTGIKMMSLLVEEVDNIDQLIQSLEGNLFTITDYFILEVLSKFPQSIKDQLLESSLLERFCKELVDTISPLNKPLAESDKTEIDLIKWLIKSNLFVISLDFDQKWFRFHQLFKNVLQNQLKKQANLVRIQEIHLIASNWFLNHNLIDEAVQHALLADNFLAAKKIICSTWESTYEKGKWFHIESWLKLLPPKEINQDAELLIISLWLAWKKSDFSKIIQLVHAIQKLDANLSQAYKGYLAFGKIIEHFIHGNATEALKNTEYALKYIPKDNSTFIADTYGWWNITMQINGAGEKAISITDEQLTQLNKTINSKLLIPRTLHTLFNFVQMANLPGAIQRVNTYLSLPIVSNYMLAWGWYFKGIVSYRSVNYSETIQHFEFLFKNRNKIVPRVIVDAYVCSALISNALNKNNDAIKYIQNGIQFALEINDKMSLAAMYSGQARLHLAQHNLEAAEKWRLETNYSELDLSKLWWLEIPAITYSRVLIATNEKKNLETALKQLTKQLNYSTVTFNNLRSIEISLLRAFLYFTINKPNNAKNDLIYAVKLAAPGNWIQPFIEMDNDLIKILKTVGENETYISFIEKVLAKLLPKEIEVISTANIAKRDNLVLFTQREMEVLLCIVDGLRNQEIAAKLFRSEETIKKHIYNMFQKVQVRNRMSLVLKAKELGFIDN